MLDEFSATTLESKDKQPDASAAAPASSSGDAAPAPGTTDFEKELQAGMAALLGELDTNPEMQKEMEALMKELSAATDLGAGGRSATGAKPSGGAAAAGTSAEATSKAGEDSFQETIRRTMERMQASGEQAGAAAAQSSQQNFLMEMLKDLDTEGFDPSNLNDDTYSKMISGLMEELTTKEILYEPMKELHEKYPDWIEKNKDKVGKEDMARYLEQQKYVAEIVTRFESASYSDSNAADKAFISEKMEKVSEENPPPSLVFAKGPNCFRQQMQNAGSPPSDLVNMNAAQEVLGDLDSGCPTQ